MQNYISALLNKNKNKQNKTKRVKQKVTIYYKISKF